MSEICDFYWFLSRNWWKVLLLSWKLAIFCTFFFWFEGVKGTQMSEICDFYWFLSRNWRYLLHFFGFEGVKGTKMSEICDFSFVLKSKLRKSNEEWWIIPTFVTTLEKMVQSSQWEIASLQQVRTLSQPGTVINNRKTWIRKKKSLKAHHLDSAENKIMMKTVSRFETVSLADVEYLWRPPSAVNT